MRREIVNDIKGGQIAWAQRLRDAVYNAVKESDIQEDQVPLRDHSPIIDC